LNQNASDLNDARQTMRFARLDFEKFLGGKIVDQILDELEIDERLARAEEADRIAAQSPTVIERPRRVERAPQADAGFDIDSMPPQVQERLRAAMAENGGEIPPEMRERMQRFQGGGDRQRGQGSGQRAGREAPVDGANRENDANSPLQLAANTNSTELSSTTNLLMDEGYMVIRNQIDFSKFADLDLLEDGEAKQQLRSLQDELQVAQEELLLTQDRIAGQRRLEERGFITPTELEAEELSLNKANNKMQQKETELKLYIQYTFPKEAEQKLSDFENAVMSYQRQVKENVAEQAQEEARFSSAERKFNLEKVKLADVNQQIVFATIRAQRPGLVVYGAADQNSSRWRRSSQEAIQEGATVTERQAILTIPDLREMAVKVNIHESAVQRVAVGQRVRVSVDAFPDDPLTGTVSRVAVVADSANSFMNPDLKVYPTTINIDGTHEWLRPGMSAEVEILVDRLEDVVYVPVQAVTYYDDQRVVYVAGRGAPQRRPIEVGSFSDSFIEIVSGLEEGEQVLLLPPQQGQGNSQPDA
jgi:multidrug resistance efflux pump